MPSVKEIKDSPKTFYAPLLTVNIPDHMIDSTEILKIARIDEFQWLQFVSDLDTFEPYTSWSVYHSRKDVVQGREKCVNSILPLLPQNVATLSMKRHCIEVTKAATELLNPGQVIVDVSDQPLYALSKQLQIIYQNEFGPGKYFPIFDGLYIEKVLLIIHGQLVEGSGLSQLLGISNLSITGPGDALIKVPHITRTRYLLEVCLCAEFKALKDVYLRSQATNDIQLWMEETSSKNDMFHYWKLIFDFQILVLTVIRAQREKNFLLYVHVLKVSMKYIFALNDHHYARWLSVHVDDFHAHVILFCKKKKIRFQLSLWIKGTSKTMQQLKELVEQLDYFPVTWNQH